MCGFARRGYCLFHGDRRWCRRRRHDDLRWRWRSVDFLEDLVEAEGLDAERPLHAVDLPGQSLPLVRFEGGQGHGRGCRRIGPRVLLDDALQRLPRGLAVAALHLRTRLPQQRSRLEVIGDGQDEIRHYRPEERGEKRSQPQRRTETHDCSDFKDGAKGAG